MKTETRKCSECGGHHPAEEMQKKERGVIVQLGAHPKCIWKSNIEKQQRRRSWGDFWSDIRENRK